MAYCFAQFPLWPWDLNAWNIRLTQKFYQVDWFSKAIASILHVLSNAIFPNISVSSVDIGVSRGPAAVTMFICHNNKLLQYWERIAASLLPPSEQPCLTPDISYTSQWAATFPLKMPLPLGGSGPSYNTCFIGPKTQTASRSVRPF